MSSYQRITNDKQIEIDQSYNRREDKSKSVNILNKKTYSQNLNSLNYMRGFCMDRTVQSRCQSCTEYPPCAFFCPQRFLHSCYLNPKATEISQENTKENSNTYGYLFHKAVTTPINTAVINPSNDILFSNHGPLQRVSHALGTAIAVIMIAGKYHIEYSINYSNGIGSTIGLAVNGIIESATQLPLMDSSGQVSGTTILSLSQGDVISIRNSSISIAFTLALNSISAQMTIRLID